MRWAVCSRVWSFCPPSFSTISHRFTTRDYIQIIRYRLGLSHAVEVTDLVTCGGVLILSSSLDISVNMACAASEAESEKKRAINA